MALLEYLAPACVAQLRVSSTTEEGDARKRRLVTSPRLPLEHRVSFGIATEQRSCPASWDQAESRNHVAQYQSPFVDVDSLSIACPELGARSFCRSESPNSQN
jgi:hypothetical protein